MGMYTELVMACTFSKLNDNDIKILMCMVGGEDFEETVVEIPDHPLFLTSRWKLMLCSDSYYFDGVTHSNFAYDSIGKDYRLTVRCNLKNYDDEIEKFLDWIIQKSDTQGFVGYTRHETAKIPSLIYFDGYKVNVR